MARSEKLLVDNKSLSEIFDKAIRDLQKEVELLKIKKMRLMTDLLR